MLHKPARWLPFVTWFPLMSLGFYIGRKFPSTWDVGVFIFTTELSAVILLLYLCIWDLIWKAYLGQIDTTVFLGKKEPDGFRAIPNLSEEKAIIYTQSTSAPRFDLERHMAVIILRQIEFNDAPDFREATWVQRGKHNKFSTRSSFIAVLEKWKRLRAIDRSDPERKNSSYVVTDERVIRLIANGEKFE